VRTATSSRRWARVLDLLVCASLLATLGVFASLGATPAAAQKISLKDPTGDDNGPGKYVYPTDPVYLPGSFDMTGFELKAHKDTVEIQVSMAARLTDPWQTGSGFSLQMVFVFLQTGGPEQALVQKTRKMVRAEKKAAEEKAAAEKKAKAAAAAAAGETPEAGNPADKAAGTPGATDKPGAKPEKIRKPYGFVQGLPGLNLGFAPADGWDHCIILSPLPAARVEAEVAAKVPAELRGAILVPAHVKGAGHTISATVDRKTLGKNDPRTWGYQVVVVGSDPFPGTGSLLVRPVLESEQPLRFGGGSDGDCDPNVLDVLAEDASGDAHEVDLQHDQLQYECNPDGTVKKLATLKLVYVPNEAEEEKANANDPNKPPGSPTPAPGTPFPPPQ
jgi:carbohydrate-binding DOMON domain-containing protein